LCNDWISCQQVVEITRERTIKGVTTVEVAHRITSKDRKRASAADILKQNRDHWGIENGLHYRRDVSMREDASRIRKDAAPQVMATLRNLCNAIAKSLGRKSLPDAMRHLMLNPAKAVGIVSRPGGE
jgi:predicted transposase YbfD/YdcC